MIADRELASKLAAWPSLVAEVYENATWLVDHNLQDYSPFLFRHVGGLWMGEPRRNLEGYPPTRFPPRTEELFSDSLLEGHLYARAVRFWSILRRYRTLAQEAESIMALIQR